MTATLIDGTAIAADIRQKIAARVAELTTATGRKPGLATVLVGEDPASQAYVRMKGKNSLEVGMAARHGADRDQPGRQRPRGLNVPTV